MSMLKALITSPKLAQLGPIALALALSLAAGGATLLIPSPYAPLGVLAAIIAAAVGLVLLFRPVAALYLLVFVVLLPFGLIPLDFQSVVRNLALLLAFGAWMVQVLFGGRRVMLPAPVLLLASVIVAHIVSVSWAPDLILARSEIVQWIIVLLMMVLLLNVVDTTSALAGLMRVFAVNGWVLVLAGLYAMVVTDYQPGDRLKVFEMNENSYGVALILTTIGVIWLALQPGRARRPLLLLSFAYLPLASLLTVFTGSRGSLLSFALMIGLFLVFPLTRVWGWYCAILGVVAFIVAPGLFASTTSRLGNVGESLTGDRVELWQASLDMIYDYPWGAGAGSGPSVLYDYILRYTTNFAYRPDLPSHNPILEVGIDTGLLGMLLYCTMLAVTGWGFLRAFLRHRAAGDHSWEAYFAVLVAVAAGYFLSWIKAGGVYYTESFILQLALLALPACAPMFQPQRPEPPRAEVQP